ncbi:hypothetical protein J3A83DRAFT_4370693 [Scleroderma citrinum]
MGNSIGKSKTKSIEERDVVVFLVGPAGAGKSTLMDVLDKDGRATRNPQSLDPSTKEVQAWTYRFERIQHNIVLVDTPSFLTGVPGFDAEGIMRKWIQLSKFAEKCHDSRILYLHNLAGNPEEQGLMMQEHLDTFANAFPQKRGVPSLVYVVPTIDKGLKPGSEMAERNFSKLETAVKSLSPKWSVSMFPDITIA